MPDLPQTAHLGSRILAFAYDYLLISAYLILLFVVAFVLMNSSDSEAWSELFSSPVRTDLVAFLTTILPVALYFAFTESSSRQASWGKFKRGLRVESGRGERIPFRLALIRSFLKLLPWQLAHTCLFNIPGWPENPSTLPTWVVVGLSTVWILVGIYVVSAVVTKDHLTLYDRILGTRVVYDIGERTLDN